MEVVERESEQVTKIHARTIIARRASFGKDEDVTKVLDELLGAASAKAKTTAIEGSGVDIQKILGANLGWLGSGEGGVGDDSIEELARSKAVVAVRM